MVKLIKMSEINNCYQNKTKIPEYLQPLKRIKYDTYRKYRRGFSSPEPLLKLCANILDNLKMVKHVENSHSWSALADIFSYSSRVCTDSARQLCMIRNPADATLHIIKRSKQWNLNTVDLLQKMNIILSQSIEDASSVKTEKHWKKLSTTKTPKSIILIGRS